MGYTEYILAPERGGNRPTNLFLLRAIDNFFRRWPLFVLPCLLLIGAGVLRAQQIPVHYQATGVLSISSNPLLQDSVPQAGVTVYPNETPAAAASRIINELLATDVFVQSLAAKAGLASSAPLSNTEVMSVRSSVAAVAIGDRLLRVNAKWVEPQHSLQLVEALVAGYADYLLTIQTKNYADAVQYWTATAAQARQAESVAQSAVQDYLSAHPAPKNGSARPVEETLDIQRLNDAVAENRKGVVDAQAKIDHATLATGRAKHDIASSMQVVDKPTQPTAPEGIRKKQALTLGIFGFLALFVLLIMVVAAASLDHSVRLAEDLGSTVGIPVVATVPNLPQMRRRLRARGVGPPSGSS